jgi:hypothetical protein
MLLDIYELSAKSLVGEELTTEQKKLLHDYDTKYRLVCYLVMEKQRLEGINLLNFQFTPGDSFMKTSALDVANAIIKSFSLPSKSVSFGDSNAPHRATGESIPTNEYEKPPRTGLNKLL